jgi:hypothetical protein
MKRNFQPPLSGFLAYQYFSSLLARAIDSLVTCVSSAPVAREEMAVEARRIDGLITAELSLSCGARALRERSTCLRSACLLAGFLLGGVLLGVFLLWMCGSGSRDDEDARRWMYSGTNCLARSNSGKNECESSRNSSELQILPVSIPLKDSKGLFTRLHRCRW